MTRIQQLHGWDLTPGAAIQLQKELAGRVTQHDDFGSVELVAGVDVGFELQGAVTRAAVAVLRLDTLACVEHRIAHLPTAFPYVPGLLSFREIPAVLEALQLLTHWPDLLLCDGQGIAHPRRFGIAAHLGLLTGLPALGVGKSRLVGRHGPVPETRGEWVELIDREEIIGGVLRSRERVKPLYISAGHRISLASSIAFVMRCVTRYRLPETTRWAHRLASG